MPNHSSRLLVKSHHAVEADISLALLPLYGLALSMLTE